MDQRHFPIPLPIKEMDKDVNAAITEVLQLWQEGDQQALNKLFPLTLPELKAIAQNAINRHQSSLQATELVNEAYLKLKKHHSRKWENRGQFFALVSRLMRHLLVDEIRKEQAQKRGGFTPLTLMESSAISNQDPLDLILLDDALSALGEEDQRKALVVDMRLFGGCSTAEIASTLEISERSVKRDWQFAKSWIMDRIQS